MDLSKYGVPFFVVVAIIALLVASPALSRLLVYPRTEFFTQLWILGPDHMADDYPFNVSRDQRYRVYVGIGNNLGYCAYYMVEVKFRNESMPAPTSLGNIENRTHSVLSSLFNITAVVADECAWELPIQFGFDYQFNDTLNQVDFQDMTFNENVLNLKGTSAAWNETTGRFYGNLIFELWIFNSSVNNFVYHDRFVDLKLNMTIS